MTERKQVKILSDKITLCALFPWNKARINHLHEMLSCLWKGGLCKQLTIRSIPCLLILCGWIVNLERFQPRGIITCDVSRSKTFVYRLQYMHRAVLYRLSLPSTNISLQVILLIIRRSSTHHYRSCLLRNSRNLL